MYRQGDLLIVKCDSIPPAARKKEDRVLAYGEATGHKHEFKNDGVTVFSWGQNGFIKADEPSDLIHDEHDTITIPEGTYRVVRQREYDGNHIRTIAD